MRFASAAFCLLFLAVLATGAPLASAEDLQGVYQGIQGNLLLLKAPPNLTYRIPMDRRMEVVQASGSPFFLAWLFPGDGVLVALNRDGRAVKLMVDIRWYAGTVAHTSPDRLTLLEGDQFYASPSTVPVYLNGQRVEDLARLSPPQQAVVRVDRIHRRPVGIWVFDFQNPDGKHPSLFQATTSVVRRRGNELAVELRARGKAGGIVWGQLVGATQRIRLQEVERGEYEAVVSVPRGAAIRRTHLWLEWVQKGSSAASESWAVRDPVTIYSDPPSVLEISPPDGATVSVSPLFISVAFDPEKAPVDPDSVRLMMDGKNVTEKSYRDRTLVFYASDDLSLGKHECALTGRTMGGGVPFQVRWSFITT